MGHRHRQSEEDGCKVNRRRTWKGNYFMERHFVPCDGTKRPFCFISLPNDRHRVAFREKKKKCLILDPQLLWMGSRVFRC